MLLYLIEAWPRINAGPRIQAGGSDSLVLIESGGFYPKFYGILLYVAKQNFKISMSEYLRCASKRAISRLNIQKFSGEGAQPPPQTPPRRGGGHPLPAPYPLGALGASLLAPLALVPPTQKSWLRPCSAGSGAKPRPPKGLLLYSEPSDCLSQHLSTCCIQFAWLGIRFF